MNRAAALRAVSMVVLAAVVGILGVWLGLFPLSAVDGHWPVTKMFLDFTKRRHVAMRATGVPAPPALDDSKLVVRGAGHFETGCGPCHGVPGALRPVPLRYMRPRPPVLSEVLPQWEDRELFWIVRNGIKLTGMPGWPAPAREDEVWAIVAFLRALPSLSPEDYRRLAFGHTALEDREVRASLDDLTETSRQNVLSNCSRCHGIDGLGGLHGAFPKLAGQREAYLIAALEAYATGTRPSGIMESVAAALPDDTIRELAAYYGRLSAFGSESPGSSQAAGASIARDGIPELRVPSCSDCHGPGITPRRDVYPRLAGQDAAYLVQQLELFESGARGGSEFAHLMDPVASRLPASAMREVANYYASLED